MPGYSERLQIKAQEQESDNKLVLGSIDAFKDLGIEFMRTAVANPLTGMALTIISADVLYRMKVISVGARNLIWTTVVVAFGVTVTVDVINELESIFGGGNAADSNLVRPNTSTIVQPPTSNAGGTAGGLMAAVKSLAGVLPQGAKAAEAVIPAA